MLIFDRFVFLTPQERRYFYRIAMAAIPLLVATGVVTSGVAPLIIGVVAAVLGIEVTSLADRHVEDAPDAVELDTETVQDLCDDLCDGCL